MKTIRFVYLSALASAPSSAEGLTWRESLEEAFRNNAALASAQSSYEASRASANGAYSAFFPQVSANLNYNRSGPLGEATGDPSNSYGAALSASQSLFSGMRDKANVDRSRAAAEAARFGVDAARAQLSYDLKSAFAALNFAQKSLRLYRDVISKRRIENLRIVELRYENGRENKGSVLVSKANVNQVKLEELQAENNLDVARARLAATLGREDGEALELADEAPVAELPATRPNFADLVVTTPSYRQLAAQAEAAAASLVAARAGFFPSIDVSAGMGRSGPEWFPESGSWSVGATLSIPLFNGLRDLYATRTAAAAKAAATENRVNALRAAQADLRRAYADFREAIERVRVDESFLVALETRAEIARSQYNNGLLSFNDWDGIENDLIARQRNMLDSRRNLIVAGAAWERALGKGATP